MEIIKTAIPDVLLIKPRVFHDRRGCFYETFQANRYGELIPPFVQDNCSRSIRHVLRGLHYQQERPQGKLVFVPHGHILDVAVDIRRGSPYFGQYVAIELSDENCQQLYIPPGFAHGFCVLSERADVIYKCTDYYVPSAERGLLWNDPTLRIAWPIDAPIMSDKDLAYGYLSDIEQEALPEIT